MAYDKDTLEYSLRRIASLGGDYSDIQLTTRSGPNDAIHRGLLYISSRNIALQALGKRTAKFPDEDIDHKLPEAAEHLYCVVAQGRLGGNERVTQIGDFTKEECEAFAERLNRTRYHPYDGDYAIMYKVAEYACRIIETV